MFGSEAGATLKEGSCNPLWHPTPERPTTPSAVDERVAWPPRSLVGRAIPLDEKSRSAPRTGEDSTLSNSAATAPTAEDDLDQDYAVLRGGQSATSVSAIRLRGKPLTGETSMRTSRPELLPDRGSDLAPRMLNQLSLSAWLPPALFAGSLTVIVQFRLANSVDILHVTQGLTSTLVEVAILTIPLFLVTKVLLQAFSFAAIRTLEGYWRKGGLAGLARTLMIRRHVRRKEALGKRRREASEKAFFAAKARMASKGIPCSIIDAFEAQVLHQDLPNLTEEESRRFTKMNWRTLCDAWHLAAVDHLLSQETAYPATSRVLPTRLGNLLRATEDTLENATGDVEGFALRHHGKIPQRLQMQHDQLRSQLAMFCTIVFLGILISLFTPIILVGAKLSFTSIGVICGSFVMVSVISYLAAIATASGYCAVLKQMDQTSRNFDRE